MIGDLESFGENGGTVKFTMCLDSSISNNEKQKILSLLPGIAGDVVLHSDEKTSLKNIIPRIVFN